MKTINDILEGFFKTAEIGLDGAKKQVFERCKKIISLNSKLKDSDIVVNDDLTVSINSKKTVYFYKIKDRELGVTFKKIGGSIEFNMCDIETLKGLPKTIYGALIIKNCPNIKNLKDGPQKIRKHTSWPTNNVSISYCDSLEDTSGIPEGVEFLELKTLPKFTEFKDMQDLKGVVAVNSTETMIKDLKGLPRVITYINIHRCNELESLKSTCQKAQRLHLTCCEKIDNDKDSSYAEKVDFFRCKHMKDTV